MVSTCSSQWPPKFFFCFMTKIPLKAEKLQHGTNNNTKLHTIQVHQGPNYRRRNTSPQMAYIITSSKLGKLMCNPIKVHFQVPNLPASKAIEETHVQPYTFQKACGWGRWYLISSRLPEYNEDHDPINTTTRAKHAIMCNSYNKHMNTWNIHDDNY